MEQIGNVKLIDFEETLVRDLGKFHMKSLGPLGDACYQRDARMFNGR
jgi:hypothetical protein